MKAERGSWVSGEIGSIDTDRAIHENIEKSRQGCLSVQSFVEVSKAMPIFLYTVGLGFVTIVGIEVENKVRPFIQTIKSKYAGTPRS